MILTPAYRIEDSFQFCDCLQLFARSVGPTVKKRNEKKKLGMTIEARQNGWRLLREPARRPIGARKAIGWTASYRPATAGLRSGCDYVA